MSATKFEKDALIEKAINLNIWKGISNGEPPILVLWKINAAHVIFITRPTVIHFSRPNRN